jgi:hypothetical protein
MKPDCRNGLQRKSQQGLLLRYDRTFSPVPFDLRMLRKRGDFWRVLENQRLDSLLPRLSGGESGIRTRTSLLEYVTY